MINIVFSKMEAYSQSFNISLSKLQTRNSLIPTTRSSIKTPSIEDGDLSQKVLSEKSMQINRAGQLSTETQQMHLATN
jgi:hypothetical protein